MSENEKKSLLKTKVTSSNVFFCQQTQIHIQFAVKED